MGQYDALAAAMGDLMKDLIADRIERGVALGKLLCANEQQPICRTLCKICAGEKNGNRQVP